MKHKWWIIAAATIAGCIGLAFVIPALRPPRPGVTKENFDCIEIGMAYDDVVAILGLPEFIHAFDHRGARVEGHGAPFWQNDRADQAWIDFDENNRVWTKDWHEDPDERGVFEKVMDQLPWREKPVPARIRGVPKLPGNRE